MQDNTDRAAAPALRTPLPAMPGPADAPQRTAAETAPETLQRGTAATAAQPGAATNQPATAANAPADVPSVPALGHAAPPLPKEIGGAKGPEPTRYGDWAYKGRCTDF